MAIIPGKAINNNNGNQLTVGEISKLGGLTAFKTLNQKMDSVFHTHFGIMQHWKEWGEGWFWKPDFYDKRFPAHQEWWNEFDGVTREEVQYANWRDPKWIFEKTELIHECHVSSLQGGYAWMSDYTDGKRWVFANLRYLGRATAEYAFLGLYELDAEKTAHYATHPYNFDDSFPGGKGVVPHRVFKRVKTDWQDGHLLWKSTTDNSQEEG